MAPYPLTIIAQRIADLERRHERMWLCRNLFGQTVLLFREPKLSSCQAFAAYQSERWAGTGGKEISRLEVARLICITLTATTIEAG